VPSEADHQLAREHGKDCDRELAKIRDHEFKRAYSDAAAVFRNWLRNDFGKGAPSPQRGAGEAAAGTLIGLVGARESLAAMVAAGCETPAALAALDRKIERLKRTAS
jgi:hypothetical protein